MRHERELQDLIASGGGGHIALYDVAREMGIRVSRTGIERAVGIVWVKYGRGLLPSVSTGQSLIVNARPQGRPGLTAFGTKVVGPTGWPDLAAFVWGASEDRYEGTMDYSRFCIADADIDGIMREILTCRVA